MPVGATRAAVKPVEEIPVEATQEAETPAAVTREAERPAAAKRQLAGRKSGGDRSLFL